MTEQPELVHPITKEEIDLQAFWAIVPDGLAWGMGLRNLLRGHEETANDFLLGLRNDGKIVYYLNRKVFPAERIAAFAGLPLDKLTDKIHTITLPALEKADRPNQPKPTVNYYGEC